MEKEGGGRTRKKKREFQSIFDGNHSKCGEWIKSKLTGKTSVLIVIILTR
jgi:hypothetical protein